ncbi:MAG TPA: hypothetical protein VGH08_01115 [Chthoniobacterales bacterium]|jgi:hypothetical protein
MRDKVFRVGTLFGWVLLAITPVRHAQAQFTPGLLGNDSYWSDGKAEFNIYDARLIRDGQPRKCEVLHIFLREWVNRKTLARIGSPKEADAKQVIRMNQIWSVPIGMFMEQGSIVGSWWPDSASLARLMFVGTDSFGNAARKIELNGPMLTYTSDTYGEGSAFPIPISSPPNAVFYDELPLRVRTIDWSKPEGEFDVQVAPTLTRFKDNKVEFRAVKISWKMAEKSIEVIATEPNGKDRFILDRNFPYLLREWQMADGSTLKMKRGLKADYWNYSKDGDRERALKNPMLQHPD